MARARRPADWGRDLAASKKVEAQVAERLRESPLVSGLEDHTAEFERLDFSFVWAGSRVWLDVKEKRQPYSAGIGELWASRERRDLFILDETVYRRIVWQGGGGYLAVHDLPGARWAFFGPWELTLGPKRRYNRWIEKAPGRRLPKGKLLLDLSTAPVAREAFSVEALGGDRALPSGAAPALRLRAPRGPPPRDRGEVREKGALVTHPWVRPGPPAP